MFHVEHSNHANSVRRPGGGRHFCWYWPDCSMWNTGNRKNRDEANVHLCSTWNILLSQTLTKKEAKGRESDTNGYRPDHIA